MGHLFFIFLHLIAIMFGFVFLIITIPLHIIYSSGKKKEHLLQTIASNQVCNNTAAPPPSLDDFTPFGRICVGVLIGATLLCIISAIVL